MTAEWFTTVLVLGVGHWQMVRPSLSHITFIFDLLFCRIESASYFLANTSTSSTPYAKEFAQAIDKLISEMEEFQRPDGYLNVYFTIVDSEGRFKNLRDMHEMCKTIGSEREIDTNTSVSKTMQGICLKELWLIIVILGHEGSWI